MKMKIAFIIILVLSCSNSKKIDYIYVGELTDIIDIGNSGQTLVIINNKTKVILHLSNKYILNISDKIYKCQYFQYNTIQKEVYITENDLKYDLWCISQEFLLKKILKEE
jgi:hypothetical protein